jgi:hypothetical protein
VEAAEVAEEEVVEEEVVEAAVVEAAEGPRSKRNDTRFRSCSNRVAETRF